MHNQHHHNGTLTKHTPTANILGSLAVGEQNLAMQDQNIHRYCLNMNVDTLVLLKHCCCECRHPEITH